MSTSITTVSEMNDRSATTAPKGAELGRVDVTQVRPLEHDDTVVGPEPFVELAVPDVERDHRGRPVLQQARR